MTLDAIIAQHGEPEKWQKVRVSESKSKRLSQRSAWLAEEEGVGSLAAAA